MSKSAAFVKFVRALRNALFGSFHRHSWVLFKEVRIFETSNSSMPYASKYILQCRRCGDMKKRKL